MYAIGVMPMPADFKYMDVLKKGKPQHEQFDSFSIRHPQMACSKRAKIFAPFDALRGFNFAISRKEVLYVDKPELGYEQQRELNRKLDILHQLTFNSRLARHNQIYISVQFFVLCQDRHHEAFGIGGQIHTIEGYCKSVDPDVEQTIQVDDTKLRFSDIIRIDSPSKLFHNQYADWQYV